MKNLFNFVILLLVISASFILWGCDAAEDFAEQQNSTYDTVIVITDTIKNRTEVKLVPVKFELEIQLGSFASKTYADNLSAKADSVLKGKTEVIFQDNIYRVCAGRFVNPEKANAYLEYVKEKGFGNAFIRKVKKINDEQLN